MTSENSDLSIQIQSVEQWQPPEGQTGQGMLLQTSRGPIEAIIHHEAETPTQKGIVWVWGARGGFVRGAVGKMAPHTRLFFRSEP